MHLLSYTSCHSNFLETTIGFYEYLDSKYKECVFYALDYFQEAAKHYKPSLFLRTELILWSLFSRLISILDETFKVIEAEKKTVPKTQIYHYISLPFLSISAN